MTFDEQAFNDVMLNAFEYVIIPLLLILLAWTAVSYHKLAKEAAPFLKKGKTRE
jgi:hypothetical protein